MATPPNPWPDQYAYQYTESLVLARKLTRLGQACIEQGIGGAQNHFFLRRWLRLMRLHAGEIQGHLWPIYLQRTSTDRLPNWVLTALEDSAGLTNEIVEKVRLAERMIKQPAPNWEGAEVAIARAWEVALIIKAELEAGPPPLGGDVLQQVREIVETLEE